MFANLWMRALWEQGAFRGLPGVVFGVASAAGKHLGSWRGALSSPTNCN